MKFDLLSKREREILELAAQGKLDKEIGNELGVSINTLRTYWNRIRAKVGDLSRSAFAAAWVSNSIEKSQASENLKCPDYDYWWKINLTSESALLPNFINERCGLPTGEWHSKQSYLPSIDPQRLRILASEIGRAIASGKDHFSVIHLSLRDNTDSLRHSFGKIIRDSNGVAIELDGHTVDLEDLSKFASAYSGVATFLDGEEGIWLDSTCQEILGLNSITSKPEMFEWSAVTETLHPDDRSAFFNAFEAKGTSNLGIRVRILDPHLDYTHFILRVRAIYEGLEAVGACAVMTVITWQPCEDAHE